MNRKFALLLVVVSLASCTEQSISSRIRSADRIEVVDTETGFSHTDTSVAVVGGFKEILATVPEKTDCPVQGTVIFKKDTEVLFKAGYYKDASACNMLVVDENGQRMGYRLDQNGIVYLGLYFQGLKKKI